MSLNKVEWPKKKKDVKKEKIGIARHYYHVSANVFFKSGKRCTASTWKAHFTANLQGTVFERRSKFIRKKHTEYFLTPNNLRKDMQEFAKRCLAQNSFNTNYIPVTSETKMKMLEFAKVMT